MLAHILQLALVAMAATAAFGEPVAWPAQTVRIVVPSPAGAGIDLVARMLADRLTQVWNRPVIVENRPGANSIIGTEAVARAAPDGYTLLFASDATFTVFPALYKQLPFDPQRDFAPIAQVVTFYNMLIVHPSAEAGNLPQLIAFAKAHPGRVTYATIGSGSVGHLLSVWLSHDAGIEMLHVPYKGIPQAVASVLAGETDLTWAGVNSSQAYVEEGRLNALAVAAPQRLQAMPDVPTFAELGFANIEYTQWFGMFAPAGTPTPVVERIHREVARILSHADVRDRELQSRGWQASGLGPQQFSAQIQRELAARSAIVKRSGATVN